jgi:hypothetical protein
LAALGVFVCAPAHAAETIQKGDIVVRCVAKFLIAFHFLRRAIKTLRTTASAIFSR